MIEGDDKGVGFVPKPINLKGKRFDRWTVVRLSEKRTKSGARQWHCVCKCGGTGLVSTSELRGGRSRSCGCYNREVVAAQGRARRIDLAGKTIGRLTVREKNDKGWLCDCSCGNSLTVASSSLLRAIKKLPSGTTSCGCLMASGKTFTPDRGPHQGKLFRTATSGAEIYPDLYADTIEHARDGPSRYLLDQHGNRKKITWLTRHHPVHKKPVSYYLDEDLQQMQQRAADRKHR